ncbi:MAG: hypothetical protein LUH05_07330 [Candidatus Gastranaerophilales bacterium]|nr:hypothetical protein [Candidatus Gastranaerophilales bacterium]
MTVSSIVPVNNYVGNSSTKEFDFDFLIEDEGELVVQHIDEDGVITTLTLGVDYSINEIGNEEGSYITFPLDSSSYSVLSEDETISLILSLVIKQESEFRNSSYFDFTVLEWTFDYIVRILQIMNRQIERTVKVQEGSDIDSDELVVNINTLVGCLSTIETVYNNLSNIGTTAESITDVNTCAENIEDIQNAYENAQTAITKAAEASTSVDNAQIWAEGTDEEVIALGGEHSAKVWAEEFTEGADIGLSNLSDLGENKLEAQKAYYTGNVLTDEKAYSQILEMLENLSTTGSDTYTINDEEVEIPYTLSNTGAKIVDAAYREQVQTLYEKTGTALYYTIDEENNNFTLPMGEVYGMLTKLQTDIDTVENELDGSWTGSSNTMASSSVLSATSTVSYDLSEYLPDDGEIYDVILSGSFSSGASSGYTTDVRISTDVATGFINFACAITRTSSSVYSSGQIILPVGSERVVTLTNATDYNTNIVVFRAFNYRKVR